MSNLMLVTICDFILEYFIYAINYFNLYISYKASYLMLKIMQIILFYKTKVFNYQKASLIHKIETLITINQLSLYIL